MKIMNFLLKKKNFIYFIEDYKNKKFFLENFINNFKANFLILGGYKLEYNFFIIKCLKKLRIKYFFWLERQNKKKKIKLKIIHFFIKRTLLRADGILSVGEEAKKFYKKYNKNILNIPYSIQVNKFNKRSYFKKDKINFLFVGQLIKRKGFDLLLNVIKNLNSEIHNKICFTIVGNGPLKKEIKLLVNKKNNIKYYSFQNFNKLNKFYLRNDVLLFPSRFDGWGVVPMEAMSNAMLVISSKNCGVNEIIKKNNGNLIVDSNSEDLSSAIIKCIKNRNYIKKIGAINRNLIINSIYNAKNSSKSLAKYLDKYDNRN